MSFIDPVVSFEEKKVQLHTVRFAPSASLIEFSPKGEYLGGRRGRLRDYRVIEKISSMGRSREDCKHISLSPVDCGVVASSRRSYFIPYLIKSQIGKISSFSVRSRSRLNKKIATVRKNHIPVFVTLTYHLDWPENFEGFKYHLHHFCISLFRKFPKAGLIWKLEYQKRGAPHFHLFIWGVPLEQLQDFVPEKWHNIVYAKLPYRSAHHLAFHRGELPRSEHCAQPIRSWNGVTSYAAKYFSKVDDEARGGRIWGVRGEIPFSSILTFRIDLDVALDFRKQLSESLNYEFKRLGFWCGDFSVDWLMLLDDLIDFYYVRSHCPEDNPDWDLEECPEWLVLDA